MFHWNILVCGLINRLTTKRSICQRSALVAQSHNSHSVTAATIRQDKFICISHFMCNTIQGALQKASEALQRGAEEALKSTLKTKAKQRKNK